ncbi:hypothetical protein BURMUCF2_B0084, partial [Burkholderia multivorans CF2]
MILHPLRRVAGSPGCAVRRRGRLRPADADGHARPDVGPRGFMGGRC